MFLNPEHQCINTINCCRVTTATIRPHLTPANHPDSICSIHSEQEPRRSEREREAPWFAKQITNSLTLAPFARRLNEFPTNRRPHWTCPRRWSDATNLPALCQTLLRIASTDHTTKGCRAPTLGLQAQYQGMVPSRGLFSMSKNS